MSLAGIKRQACKEGWASFIRSENDERAVLKGYRFDLQAAARVDAFFSTFLRHSKGEFAHEPFELIDWQRDDVMHPLFGWKRPNGRRRFTRTYIEIPKKNGKSTLASGVGLYMLVADGEPGAELYCAATAKDQAKIVWNEAACMVEASPDLREVLDVNKSTGNILFRGTNSYLRVLASAAGSNEGWNAHCVIVDELHKWHGRALWDALKWAFAARRQPLLFVITTAGDDPLSVCREQHDYAQGVLKGEIPDLHFFPYIRAADPEADWLDVKTWKEANPSLGVTLDLEKFREDAEEAKATPTSQTAFKRYRLNIWCTGENTWLRGESWGKCKRKYKNDELLGLKCVGGLDLAKTRDTTALALVFEMPNGKLRVRPHFWLPKETAHELVGRVPFELWAEKGFVTLTEGSVCDYEVVEKEILKFKELYDIREIAFDPNNAELLTQRLEAAGIPRVCFPQQMPHLGPATSELERLILSEGIEHNGHPVLSWQFGNAKVKTDANGYKRPIKPAPDDIRKIDGVVATVMAVARHFGDAIDQSTAYDDPDGGVILL